MSSVLVVRASVRGKGSCPFVRLLRAKMNKRDVRCRRAEGAAQFDTADEQLSLK
jgi:hypothetical protein